MGMINLGNGAALQVLLRTDSYRQICHHDNGLASILRAMKMAGSNLHDLYSWQRCEHGTPTNAAPLAHMLNNYKEEAIKVEGVNNIKGWLNKVMKNSTTLVYFTSKGPGGWSNALDLYLTNKLWINSGVAEISDEMWVWCLRGQLPKLHHSHHRHHHQSHQRPIAIF